MPESESLSLGLINPTKTATGSIPWLHKSKSVETDSEGPKREEIDTVLRSHRISPSGPKDMNGWS